MDRKLDFKATSEVAGFGKLEIGKPDELVDVIGYPRNSEWNLFPGVDVAVSPCTKRGESLADSASLPGSTPTRGGSSSW